MLWRYDTIQFLNIQEAENTILRICNYEIGGFFFLIFHLNQPCLHPEHSLKLNIVFRFPDYNKLQLFRAF
jgi:hypothetical protein